MKLRRQLCLLGALGLLCGTAWTWRPYHHEALKGHFCQLQLIFAVAQLGEWLAIHIPRWRFLHPRCILHLLPGGDRILGGGHDPPTLCPQGSLQWSEASLRASIYQFARLYRRRPVQPMSGVNHAFALWFTVQSLKPRYIIESGVHQGAGTWLLRQAAGPEAVIFSLDPSPEDVLLYRDGGNGDASAKGWTRYFMGRNFTDFAEIDWASLIPEVDLHRSLLVLDDHMASVRRVREALQHGFLHIWYDDNWKYGDCYSFNLLCSPWLGGRGTSIPHKDHFGASVTSISIENHSENLAFLLEHMEVYFEFPPLLDSCRWMGSSLLDSEAQLGHLGLPPYDGRQWGFAGESYFTYAPAYVRLREQKIKKKKNEFVFAQIERWLPAKVLRLQLQLGQCDLDVKPGAPLGRLRKAQAPSALPAGPPGGLAAPDSVAGLGGAPPPPLSCSFRVGDKVQYWSETKARWIEAIVETIRERDGSVVYDLNCKRGTPADRVRPSLLPAQDRLEVGQDVEYWSLSAGRWLQAKVLRVYGPANQCDLDVKLGAPMGRIRTASGDGRAMSPEPSRAADDVPNAQPEPDAPPAAPAPVLPEPQPLEAAQEQQAREAPDAGEAEGAKEEPEAAAAPMEPAPAAAAPAPRPVLPLPLAPRPGMAMVKVKTASLLAPLPTLSLGLGALPGGGGNGGAGAGGAGGGLDLPKAIDLFAAAAARRPGLPLEREGLRSRSREQERRERSRSRTARAC